MSNSNVISLRTSELVPGSALAQIGKLSRVNFDTAISREYVTATRDIFATAPFLRGLPNPSDDLEGEFGKEVYARMMTDSEVSADIDLLKMAALNNKYKIEPAVDRDHSEYEIACELASFVDYCVSEEMLGAPLVSTLWSMMDSLVYGFKIAELNYCYCDYKGRANLLALSSIKPKPIWATNFAVDGFMNVHGIFARYPGGAGLSGAIVPITDNAKPPISLIAREKFMIYTWAEADNDPRGHSILRPAYAAWWFKQQMLGEWLSWGAKFASSSLVGTTAPGAVPQTVLDSAGDPVTDAQGNPVCVTPEETLANSLAQFRNGSAIAIPNGAKVEQIKVESDGNAFQSAVDWSDRQIAKAVLKQILATLEGKSQSRAASESHQDVLSIVIRYIKHDLSRMVRREVFRKLVEYNFGKQYVHLTPLLDLAEGDGFPLSAESIGKLQESGYLHPSQYAEIDKQLGLPRRTVDEHAVQNRGEDFNAETRNNA